MSMVIIKRKGMKSDLKSIKITEYINTKDVFRTCDPQSGSTLQFLPRYKVEIRAGGLATIIKNATMEEIHEKYPWFFVN